MRILIMTRKIVGMVMFDFVLVMDYIDLVKKNGVILVMNDCLNQC